LNLVLVIGKVLYNDWGGFPSICISNNKKK